MQFPAVVSRLPTANCQLKTIRVLWKRKKTNMKRILFFLLLLCFFSFYNAEAQVKKKCCEDTRCKEKAREYGPKITGLVAFLGNYINTGNLAEDRAANDQKLDELKRSREHVYNDFVRTVNEIVTYFFDTTRFRIDLCLADEMPTINRSNVLAWINHFRDITPIIPSTEFCAGWKRRIELGQGASAFLSKGNVEYLGGLRGYLMYTFKGKEKCGGTFRLMAGPGFFLRSTKAYATLNSRLSLRLKDIKADLFSLGNLNLFGGYNTSFTDKFNYAEGGIEVELGTFGVNLSANYDTNNGKWGFIVGVIFANKKI